MFSLKILLTVSTPSFLFSIHFILMKSFFMSLFKDSKVGDTDIDEVLLATPEFHLPLVVDRTGKKVPQDTRGEEEIKVKPRKQWKPPLPVNHSLVIVTHSLRSSSTFPFFFWKCLVTISFGLSPGYGTSSAVRTRSAPRLEREGTTAQPPVPKPKKTMS